MTPTVLVTDTHPLLWYLGGEHRRLSEKVLGAFDRAVEGEAAIWVPSIVLWELSLLAKAGKVRPRVGLDELIQQRFFARAIHVLDLVTEDVLLAHRLRFTPDAWDTMIVAMAIRVDCPLITRDSVIHRELPCPVYWD